MIQRIQTVYLLIALVILGALPYVFPLFTMSDGKEFRFMSDSFYTVLFGLSTTLTLICILYFKKRQHQFVLNRLTIILNLIIVTNLITI